MFYDRLGRHNRLGETMKSIRTILLACALLGFVAAASAEDAKAYREGPVTNVSYIRTKPGKFNEYMNFLDGTYKKLMDANIKAGLVVSYHVYSAQPRSPHEANLLLTVTYANWAALDKVADREAVSAKVVGSLSDQDKAAANREVLRDVLGSQTLQELILK